jgi:hypothetical protein
MDDTIYAFKLTSGEELISRLTMVSWDQDPTYILDQPRSIMMSGDGRLSFAPTLFSADPDKPITLNKTSVVAYTTDLREEMRDAYLQSVSKIAIPSKKIIMG